MLRMAFASAFVSEIGSATGLQPLSLAPGSRLSFGKGGPLPCNMTVDGENPDLIIRLEGISKYVAILNECWLPLDAVRLRATGQEYLLPEALENLRAKKIAELSGRLNFFDGELWRPDSIALSKDLVEIDLSPARYSQLAVVRGCSYQDLRKILGDDFELKSLPNLFTSYGVFLTCDGYLLFALRNGKYSDQSDITGLPAGFLDRNGANPPETLRAGVEREADEEIAAAKGGSIITGKDCIDWHESRYLGLSYSLHKVWDLTNHILLKGTVGASELRIPSRDGKSEHQLFIMVPALPELLNEVLNKGTLAVPGSMLLDPEQRFEGMRETALSGAALGSIARFLRLQEKGLINGHEPEGRQILYCNTFSK